eukprot:Opistho-1_new@40156
MARRAGQRRVQDRFDLRLLLQPACQCAGGAVLGGITQGHAAQATQHQFCVVGTHAVTHAHVAKMHLLMQCLVAGDHRTHQHVGAAARVLGQGLDGDVGAQRKGVERDTRAPGVVQRGDDAFRVHLLMGLHGREQRLQIRKLQRDGTRRLQPDQAGSGTEFGGQVSWLHGVVIPEADTPGGQLMLGEGLVRAVGIVGNQHFVAGLEQGHVHQRHRRQPAGHQGAEPAAFQRRNALFQREGGGCAVQAVGVAGFMLPVALAQRRDGRKNNGRGLVDARLDRLKAGRGFVGVMDQLGGNVAHPMYSALI